MLVLLLFTVPQVLCALPAGPAVFCSPTTPYRRLMIRQLEDLLNKSHARLAKQLSVGESCRLLCQVRYVHVLGFAFPRPP